MLQERLSVSERRACRVTGQHRSTQRHEPRTGDRDEALRARLRKLSREHPRWGYRRVWATLRNDGWTVNRKKIQRLWREEGLRVPAKRRKRQRLGTSTVPGARLRAERPDQVWALDFQFDTTSKPHIRRHGHPDEGAENADHGNDLQEALSIARFETWHDPHWTSFSAGRSTNVTSGL